MNDLAGLTAVVTGASRGMGAACARALDGRGARVVLTARDGAALAEVAADLANEPAVIEADLSVSTGADDLFRRTLDAVGSVDILVNNAAIATGGLAQDLSVETLDGLLTLNLRAVIRLSTLFGWEMARRGSGAIVSVASGSGITGVPHHNVYAATKGGVMAFTKALAAEWGPLGVRINAVAPGLTNTAMTAGLHANTNVLGAVHRTINLRRSGRPEEIASVVAFLASDEASYISGEIIAVDGGLTNAYHGFPRRDGV